MSTVLIERPRQAGPGVFKLVSEFQPAGDQPQAIDGADPRASSAAERDQVLLGVTGSGKTFTMAHVIASSCSGRR